MIVAMTVISRDITGMNNFTAKVYNWRFIGALVLCGLFASTMMASPTVAFAAITEGMSRTDTVYLLLHGLNSSPDTWNDVVDNIFKGSSNCPAIASAPGTVIARKRCYRYQFPDRIIDGVKWFRGDGLTYRELGANVSDVVAVIENNLHPQTIVLVGHSRGGLAARSYLQKLTSQPPFSLALLTIGTPHQGSPFGRIKHWMDLKGLHWDDVALGFRNQLKFIFSPSTGNLATEHYSDGQLLCRPLDPLDNNPSQAICRLNVGAGKLTNYTATFGQIISRYLILGEDAVAGLNLLNGSDVAAILPGNFEEMRRYVLQNIGEFNSSERWVCSTDARKDPDSWACNGDGIVPLISQKLTRLPNFNAPVWSQRLEGVVHADLDPVTNDGETGQTSIILRILQSMASAGGFAPP